jgi:hypothetical protein
MFLLTRTWVPCSLKPTTVPWALTIDLLLNLF